jgi:hypothetical protein
MSVKFRKRALAIITSGTLLVLLAYLGARRVQQGAWERFLIPFQGEPFVGEIQGSPASSLQLADGYSLSLFRQGTNHPVLVMRSPTGSNLWKQALIPQNAASDGSIRRGLIHDMDLKFAKHYRDGQKIFVSCDWYWGGQEGGIIYIGPDQTYKSFALSW